MKQNEGKKERKSLIFRFLNTVEQVGNRLPHPITMFAALALFIVLLSGILAAAGISAEGEVIDSKTMEVTTQTVSAVSLLDRDGLVYMLTHMVSNFTEFAPLGVVLVTMLGVGCAEGSGYLSALLKKTVSVTPAKLVTPMLVFLGVMSNVASDVGYVVLIPLGAMVFLACGRLCGGVRRLLRQFTDRYAGSHAGRNQHGGGPAGLSRLHRGTVGKLVFYDRVYLSDRGTGKLGDRPDRGTASDWGNQSEARRRRPGQRGRRTG